MWYDTLYIIYFLFLFIIYLGFFGSGPLEKPQIIYIHN